MWPQTVQRDELHQLMVCLAAINQISRSRGGRRAGIKGNGCGGGGRRDRKAKERFVVLADTSNKFMNWSLKQICNTCIWEAVVSSKFSGLRQSETQWTERCAVLPETHLKDVFHCSHAEVLSPTKGRASANH
jgi:hypothetical protein